MKTVIDRKDGTREVGISFRDDFYFEKHKVVNGKKIKVRVYPERSRTKPEFYKDCNMNNIMAKYRRTGVLGDPIKRAGFYGDFSSGADFAEMMRKTTNAQSAFNELPAFIRSRFQNDPQQLVEFLHDSKNDAEAIELGLKVKPKVAEHPVIPSGSAPAAPASAAPAAAVPPAASGGSNS